jgi:cysteine-rich repeat protein
MARRRCWCLIVGFTALIAACGDDDVGGNQNANDNVRCGNGQLDDGEACDDGEANSDTLPDRCRRDCRLPSCGDGVVDPKIHETCDCGEGSGLLPDGCSGPNSDEPGTGCSTRCRVPVCGDGAVEGDETCEALDLQGETCESLDFAGGSLECFNCQLWLVGCVDGCGNLVLEGDEVCDGPDLGGKACTDVGFLSGDLACLPTCELDLSGCWAGCGNGTIELAEQCDGADLGVATCDSNGFAGGTLACGDDCTYDFAGCLGGCGNRVVETGEGCDDGNQQLWDGCNACAIAEFRVNATLDVDADRPAVAMASDGRFVVAWQEADGNGSRILARQYPASGTPSGPEILVSSSHAVGLPAVAMADDGRFVVVWSSGDPSNWNSSVYGRLYSANGSALAAEFQVNAPAFGFRIAAVAMADDGRFVVAWQGPDTDGDGISAQRFDSTGAPQGAEILVNTYTTSSQISPSVAMGADGRFVVAWESTDSAPSGYGIFAQRFDAVGVAQGTELPVSLPTAGQSQSGPSVALGGDYRFVVVWTSDTLDGNGNGVVGRRFDANGNALSSEFVVNTVTTISQEAPRVALATDGRFVVTWQNGYGSAFDVAGQRYATDGQAQGTEFQINMFTENLQQWPAVAMAGDGRFVGVWRSESQEGAGGPNVYAQRYTADGTAIGLLP